MKNLIKNFLASLIKNLANILIAVIISVVIWIATSIQLFPNVMENVSDVPVTAHRTPLMEEENLNIASVNLSEIDIQIQGKRYYIGNLNADNFTAYLDLSAVKSDGEMDVPIIVTPNENIDCSVVGYIKTAHIKVEKIVTKTLDVTINTNDIVVLGDMKIDTVNLKVEPSTLTVTGEAKLVEQLKRVAVKPVDISEIDASVEARGELLLYGTNGLLTDSTGLTLDNDYFMITIPVHKVKALPLDFTLVGANSNFDINGLRSKMIITPQNITLSSPDDSIDSLEKLELEQINISDLNYYMLRSTSRYTIAPMLPEGYGNISGNSVASLSFENIEDYNDFYFTVPKENFTIVNKPANFDVDIQTEELNITVVGPASFVQSLSPDDFSVTINLLSIELSEGTREITANCRINGNNIPAWVYGTPKVDILCTLIE